jgi:hypothetical protein
MAGEVDADTDFGEQPYVTSLFLEQCLVRRCAASVHVPRADAYVVAATASVGSRVLASGGIAEDALARRRLKRPQGAAASEPIPVHAV